MKLFEHPDFEQAILRATEHFHNRGLRAAIIERDYYVTEALRLIATKAPDKIIFKGGTSLAKGWNLIQRFSEDIDIFLDPLSFKPRLGKNVIDRELKKLRDTVGSHAALTFVACESKTIGGFGRNDRFSYIQLFEKCPWLRRDFLRSFQVEVEDLRAQTNFEVIEHLSEREQQDWAHFGKLRREWDRQFEDPDDVYLKAEQREKERGKQGLPPRLGIIPHEAIAAEATRLEGEQRRKKKRSRKAGR